MSAAVVPPNCVVVPTFSSSVIRRDTERPCQCYIDLNFLDQSKKGGSDRDGADADTVRMDALVFQNFYTSTINIGMETSSMDRVTYVNILENRTLMPSPYHENGSQDWYTISVSEFNDKYIPGRNLRITMIQPGSMWDRFEIRNVVAVCKTSKISKNGSSSSNALDDSTHSYNNTKSVSAIDDSDWNARSLTSLMKDDVSVLLSKAANEKEKHNRENSYMEQLLNAVHKNTSTNVTTKGKKDKKKSNVKKIAGGALAEGGVKKVKIDLEEVKLEGQV